MGRTSVCSKKSIQQGHSQFQARSVRPVREHRKLARTPLVAFFNRPYWDIGRIILERQAAEGWGKSVVERLSTDLRQEFPGVGGFSVQNLWYMRQFYAEYHDNERLQPLVGEIAWAHNLAIMGKCKDLLEREFYLRMTRKFGWSKNVLIHQIENQSYEKSLLGQTNFEKTLTPELRAQAKLAVRDEYTFDFLELGEKHSERELERALIGRIEDFLRAMGGMFAFGGSQDQVYRILHQIVLPDTHFHENLEACRKA
jgi:predicted nuclease of restriction endonuclease-like (RecB) superfamily